MSRRHSPNDKSKIKTSTSPLNTSNDEQRYCICQKREDELNDQDANDFMIECDGCNGWFHGKCVVLADRIADDIEKYFCNECSNQHGPSIFKQRKNQHRRDYSDANADNKPTQSGTQDFINKLKRKIFPNCEPVITRLKGNQVTTEYLAKTGFTKPILVTNRDGLDLALPSRTITLAEINELVGPDRFIDIIDCEKQVTYKMGLEEYIEYFESFDRNKIYNVLSLEISNTKLGELVTTPRIVRDLSWATIGVWPTVKQEENTEDNLDLPDIKRKATWSLQSSKKKRRTVSSTDTDQSDDEQFEGVETNHFENFERPEVAKYCLISPQSSYTDFHVDFGGSSVWYSVVRVSKIAF
jgi:lysine-specific demethylase PHF8